MDNTFWVKSALAVVLNGYMRHGGTVGVPLLPLLDTGGGREKGENAGLYYKIDQ